MTGECCPTCKRPYRDARLTDPGTSHQPSLPGAESMAARILRYLYSIREASEPGRTSWAIGERLCIRDDAARRRTSDLIRRGLIAPTGRTAPSEAATDRPAQRRVLAITDEGVALVEKWGEDN